MTKHNENEAQLIQLLGEAGYLKCKGKKHFCVYLENGSCLLNFSYCDIHKPVLHDSAVYCYCNETDCILISTRAQCQQLFAQIPNEGDPYLRLVTFLNELLANDIDVLETLDSRITELEDSLLQGKRNTQSTVQEIVVMRRQLLHIKRYYEQFQFVADALAENTHDVLSETVMRRCSVLTRRIGQLLNFTQDLREAITQTREVYQTQIDTEQNHVMKIFTIITTIFMPMTVIVGWYGMNFETMPELHWVYGYPYVILLSVAVCMACALVFKKKKWF